MSFIQTFDEVEANNCVQATALCQKIGNALAKHYPRRKWYVDVNWEGKIASVFAADISMEYGYQLHINKISEEIEKAAVKAGGELLERFKLSRERLAFGGHENLIRDLRGNAMAAKQGGL